MAEPGITQPEVLKLNKPDKGYFDWDVPLNENWDKLDQLGAGQLPLLTPLEINYKLSGDAMLGWGLQGSYVDADIYTSLWDMVWAARQRAGEPNQPVELGGATYYISRDSVTGLYFTTADSYERSLSGYGSSLGMICEYDASSETKTLRLKCDEWIRKAITDYDVTEAGTHLPDQSIPESLPTHKHVSGVASVNAVSSFGVATTAITGNLNQQYGDSVTNHPYTSGYTDNSVYQDGARVQQRAHTVYRYYKIGNTIQNQGMIDVGALTEAVSELETEVSRINTDIDNKLTKTAGYPNYNARTAVPDKSTWTVISDGVVILTGLDFSGGNLFITIDGVRYTSTSKIDCYGCGAASYWPVTKGQKVLVNWEANYSQHVTYF